MTALELNTEAEVLLAKVHRLRRSEPAQGRGACPVIEIIEADARCYLAWQKATEAAELLLKDCLLELALTAPPARSVQWEGATWPNQIQPGDYWNGERVDAEKIKRMNGGINE